MHRVLLSLARGSVGCKEDHQCPMGYFCEAPTFSCRSCLSCEQLHRQPPRGNTSCVTSVTLCGACVAGLVPEPADNKCVSPDEQQLLLPYEWAVIAISLLLAVIICAVAVYVLRNFNTFKIFASTRTSIHPPVDVEASAPQLPPSYSGVTASLPTKYQLRNDNEREPFIKPIPVPSGDAREMTERQAARLLKNPSYVRTSQQRQTSRSESPNVLELLSTIKETDTISGAEDSASSFSKQLTPSEPSKRPRSQ